MNTTLSEIAVSHLKNAISVAVLTGAGISAESGIKTFRDPDGLWSKFDPIELASINGFMSNPELVWGWYRHRVEIVESAKPNLGHITLSEMEDLFEDFSITTQNVDGLHQRAGSLKVFELHGSIVKNKCFSCNRPYEEEVNLVEKKLPLCKTCGGKIRPAVVWFGEMLPRKEIELAVNAATNSDVYITIGTSGEVYPAANLPAIAKANGAYLIEVNPKASALTSQMDCFIEAKASEGLPMILNAIK